MIFYKKCYNKNMKSIEDRIYEKYNFSLDNNYKNKCLLLEVTNACNNRCIFCANRKMTRARRNIDFELAKKILTECHQLGIREVGFYATGEPLLYNKLDLLIKYAKEIGYNYIYLTTNGLLADRKKVENLLQNGLNSIKFSINALNKHDYYFIHGVDKFDVVINNLKSCYTLKSSYQFNLYVSYISTKHTNYDNNWVKDFFTNMCDETIVQSVKNQGGLVPLINDLLVIDNTKSKKNFNIPCSYVFNTITVSAEGYLTACCMDFQNYLAYADLNKVSVKEGLNNDIINNFKHKQEQGHCEGSLCELCIFNKYNNTKPLVKKFASLINQHYLFEDFELGERLNAYLNNK